MANFLTHKETYIGCRFYIDIQDNAVLSVEGVHILALRGNSGRLDRPVISNPDLAHLKALGLHFDEEGRIALEENLLSTEEK